MTERNHILFLQKTSCTRKLQVISGEGVRTACTLLLDPPLSRDICLVWNRVVNVKEPCVKRTQSAGTHEHLTHLHTTETRSMLFLTNYDKNITGWAKVHSKTVFFQQTIKNQAKHYDDWIGIVDVLWFQAGVNSFKVRKLVSRSAQCLSWLCPFNLVSRAGLDIRMTAFLTFNRRFPTTIRWFHHVFLAPKGRANFLALPTWRVDLFLTELVTLVACQFTE